MVKKVSKSNVKVQNKNRSKRTFAKRNASKLSNVGKRPQITKSKKKLEKRGTSDAAEKRVPSGMNEKPKKKGIKRKFNDVESSDDGEFMNDDVETWESKPRYHFEGEPKSTPGGEADEEPNDEIPDEEIEIDEESEEEDIPVAEMLLRKKQAFIELKDKVGSIVTSILADPHRNVLRIKTLVSLLDDRKDVELFPSLFVRDQCLVALSLLELFKDILPTYRVMEKTVEEMNPKTKMRRETKELREFETTLLKYYKVYVDRMERMIECIRRKRKSNFYNFISSNNCRQKLALVGSKCLSDLLVTHPYFNFRDDLIKSVVPLLSSRNEGIREMVFGTVSTLYREDKSGHVSYAAVKETAKLIKALKLDVEPLAIKSFLSLRIKEVKRKVSEIDMRKLRDQLDHLSKKDRKYNKKMSKLTAQLRETEAQEDQKKKLEFHTQILNQIFFVYFRLLKDIIEFEESNERILDVTGKINDCLTPILEGLSKFCHLINVDFYDDLIGLLYRLIICGKLNNNQVLLTINTVFTVLSGEGSSVNVDPHRFYVRFYSTLPRLNSSNFGDENDAELLCECLDKMFFKRKKQLSVSRVSAFCKRLVLVALQSSPPMTALILSSIRLLMRDHPKSEVLLDLENFATGRYMPELEDPDFCNAGASRLWELQVLKCHQSAMIRLLSLSLLKGSRIQTELCKKSPIDMYLEVASQEDKRLKEMINAKVN